MKPTNTQWNGLVFAPVVAIDEAPRVVSDGQITADEARTTPVFSPFTGRIIRVYVASGDHVRRGQPLFAIAGQEAVQAAADLKTTRTALAAARTAFVEAQRDMVRQNRLTPGGAGAERDRETAENTLAQTRAGLSAAEAAFTAARGRAAILEIGPDTAIDGTVIVHAPQSGIVLARSAAAGQFVQATTAGGSATLFTIANIGRIWLVANLRDADVDRVHAGDPIEASVTAVPGRVFRGRIAAVGGTLDPNTRRITARAAIDNPGDLLKPGMFAEMRVLTGPAEARLAVPDSAVVYEGDGAHVWVAHPDDRSLEIRQIRTGLQSGGETTILSGLRLGERVVTSGAVFIDRAAQPD